MEDFPKLGGHGAIVLSRRHDLPHVAPPAATHIRGRDRLPLLFAFDFHIAEEIVGLDVEVDRIGADAVTQQDIGELLPDRRMPALVLGVVPREDRRAEGFAYHGVSIAPLQTRS